MRKGFIRRPAFQMLAFIIGLSAFSWPFLTIPAEKSGLWLFTHMMVCWAVALAVLFIISRGLGEGEQSERSRRKGE